MLTIRIIPCLDVEEGKVVKGTEFRNLRYAGDPVELARFYNDQGADELVLLDIGATYRSRKIMRHVVEKVSKSVFIPLTVGGGIRGIHDMREILNAGADKVAICSAALQNPQIISEGAAVFGAQCIVLSIDAKRRERSWTAYVKGGREDTETDVLAWAKKGEALGAGEILLNSIDKDGTRAGYDLELTRQVSERISIPVIASGGAGNLLQILEVITIGKADAVLIASLLHFKEHSVFDIKEFLKKREVRIRC